MSQLADGPLDVAMSPEEFAWRLDRMTGVAHPLDVVAAADRSNGKVKPPTSLRGYVEDHTYDGLLVDLLEAVPDVAWPQSVQTYNQMRRDAKLSAILDGYALQIERAQWQLDGTGCRPEVVELVSDDMDLPVKGKDKPGAARTRGVSWNTHLQSALTMLPFGHAGFELQAELVDGKARLVGLWDRPQHTIEQIHVEPKTGKFNGISQELAGGPFDKAEIGPDRLAWYAHRREGAQWFGRSILRPSFAPWLFKREMMRVLATSNRRFGQGVPTVEWANGSTPTPEQFSAAQKAITSARVGDTAGATMPPGAMMRLVGLSGGTPDTLGFIKWLDQQMATSALMQHLDLGQTETGSRALGESFIDSWTLALEAIGEEVADVATRQIAARIVRWNWGDGEPVPRVTVSGIGSRREVTAQSLQHLLDSGALSADPGLEEWVRREYRLPARTTPRPAQMQVPDHPERVDVEVAAASPAPEPAAEPEPVRYEQPELLDVQAFNPGWRDQPRRKDRGLPDHRGRWVDDPGGGTAKVRISAPRRPKPATGEAARNAAPVAMPKARRRGGVTADEQAALANYAMDRYTDINGALRSGGPSEDVADEVRLIDSALAKSPLRTDVQVGRGIMDGRKVFGREAWGLDLTGAEWTEAGYLSTTTDPDVVDQFQLVSGGARPRRGPAPAILDLRVPAGVHGIELSSHEEELLLQRGLRMRVVSDTGPGSKPRRIGVEVVR